MRHAMANAEVGDDVYQEDPTVNELERRAELRHQEEVAATVARWEAFLKIEEQAADMEDKLETRKAVDRAKGILMDQYGLKEQEAFRRIQVQSMNTRKSMREIAEAIIIAHNV